MCFRARNINKWKRMKMSRVLLQIMFSTLHCCCCVWSQDRIVGGEEIDIKDVPYMLSIILKKSHICGAGIISENWGITAAHCLSVAQDNASTLKIRSGSSNVEEGGTIHNVIEIKIHENYQSINDDFDIGVFRVDPPFTINQIARPILLPNGHNDTDVTWGLVAGWGYFIRDDPVLSANLLFVILPKVDQTECEIDFLGMYKVKDNEVCYGLRRGGRDACKGDSGGPLVNPDKMIIGITSWGNSCALSGSPGVYLDVINFKDWIRRAIRL